MTVKHQPMSPSSRRGACRGLLVAQTWNRIPRVAQYGPRFRGMRRRKASYPTAVPHCHPIAHYAATCQTYFRLRHTPRPRCRGKFRGPLVRTVTSRRQTNGVVGIPYSRVFQTRLGCIPCHLTTSDVARCRSLTCYPAKLYLKYQLLCCGLKKGRYLTLDPRS